MPEEFAEKTLRVGFVSIEDATSEASWSGTPLNMLRALRSVPGMEVELISPLRLTCKWLYLPHKLWYKLARRNFEWRRQPLSLRCFAAQVERAASERKLDVIFSTSSIPVARLKSGIPVVFWTDANFHAMDGYYTMNLCKRTQRAGRRQEELALRRADFACYASQWAADGTKQFAESARVKVLPFGPNLPIRHTRRDVEQWIRERRAARPHGCSLLFVGRNWLRKGGDTAVETARHMNDAGIPTTLRVVGCTPPGPLPPFVEVVGFINKREPADYERLLDLYRTSDIFILSSRAEPFGIVAAEAAAFGLPALVSDTGGLSETVRDGVSGFRIPLEADASQWAQQSQAVLGNYNTFALHAYNEFASRLNWNTSIQALVELMQHAVRHPHASAH